MGIWQVTISKITLVSIVPIELYTTRRVIKIERFLKSLFLIRESTGKISEYIRDIVGHEARVYDSHRGDKVIFFGTGVIFVREEVLKNNEAFYVLQNRKFIHSYIINRNEKLLIFLSDLFSDSKRSNINYVFSFFVSQTTLQTNDDVCFAKLLAEPSLVGIEDNNISPNCSVYTDAGNIPQKRLDEFIDCDMNNNISTFITWAGISTVSGDSELLDSTKLLLISLEVRLQSVWNKCYVSGHLVDEILNDRKNSKNNIEEIYWSTLMATDNARGVINSTYSSRVSYIFDRIVETSKIINEVNRLEYKLKLAQDYISQNNNKRSKKYQKMTNIILLFIAVFTMAPSLVSAPLIKNEEIGYIIISVMIIAGVIIMFFSSS